MRSALPLLRHQSRVDALSALNRWDCRAWGEVAVRAVWPVFVEVDASGLI